MKDWFEKNPWVAFAFFTVTILGVLGFIVEAPPRAWELLERLFEVLPWEGVVSVILIALGIGGTHVAGSILPPKRRDADGRTVPPDPPSRTAGFIDVEMLIYVVLMGFALLTAAAVGSGCTPTGKAAFERILLSAAEYAVKFGAEAIENEIESHSSGGENP